MRLSTRLIAPRRAPRLLGAALLIVLVMSGCGGGRAPTVSRAHFVAEASEICKGTSQRIQAELAAYGRSRGEKEAERAEKAGKLSYAEAAMRLAQRILIPAKKQELDEFRALGIPQEDSQSANALLSAFEEGIEKAEEHPERAVQDGTEAFGKQERLADEYGLRAC